MGEILSEEYKQIMDKNINDPFIFNISNKELKERQSEMLRLSFKHHYENCKDYQKYCDAKGVKPDKIQSLDDAFKIPLLDSSETLRKRQFLSVPEKDIIAKFSSTGTTGKPVIWCPRDQITFNWQGLGTLRCLNEFADLKPGESLIMVPDMPNLPFCQVLKKYLPMEGHKISIGLKHKMEDGKPNVFPDTEQITSVLSSENKPKNLFGYPFTIAQLKDLVDTKGIKTDLGKDGIIITGGGWKAKSETMPYAKLSRLELEKLLSDTFNVPTENIIDVYSCTELTFGCWECVTNENGKKVRRRHVAPWMYMLILDPDTLEPLPEGKIGRAAFYDFGSHSYPGFILTEDLMKIVKENGCDCGRNGQVIEYMDRIKEMGERGCAFHVRNKLFSEEYLENHSIEGTTEKIDTDQGVLEYLQNKRKEVDSDYIQEKGSGMIPAIESIIEIFEIMKTEGSLIESLDIVNFGKNLCYKNGKATTISVDDLIKKTHNIKKEKIFKLIEKFENAGLLTKEEKDGKTYVKLTKKADELGEALYPMIIWGMKWTKEQKVKA
jgi:long-chain-fatty-acid---luciferin-component ligase